MKWYHWLGIGGIVYLLWRSSTKAAAAKATQGTPQPQQPQPGQVAEEVKPYIPPRTPLYAGPYTGEESSYVDANGQKWVLVFSAGWMGWEVGDSMLARAAGALNALGIPKRNYNDYLDRPVPAGSIVSMKSDTAMYFVMEQDAVRARAAIVAA